VNIWAAVSGRPCWAAGDTGKGGLLHCVETVQLVQLAEQHLVQAGVVPYPLPGFFTHLCLCWCLSHERRLLAFSPTWEQAVEQYSPLLAATK